MTPPASESSVVTAHNRQNAVQNKASPNSNDATRRHVIDRLRRQDNHGVIRAHDHRHQYQLLPHNDEEHHTVVEDIIKNERLMQFLGDRHQQDILNRQREQEKAQKPMSPASSSITSEDEESETSTTTASLSHPNTKTQRGDKRTKETLNKTAETVQGRNISFEYSVDGFPCSANDMNAAMTLCQLVRADEGPLLSSRSGSSSKDWAGRGG